MTTRGPEYLTVQFQWHAPDQVWAAGLIRDGKPWILDGALVGMGVTRSKALACLIEYARHLVIHGNNYLSDGSISRADREWLFSVLEPDDPHGEMHAALHPQEAPR